MADPIRVMNFLNLTASLAHQLNNDLAAVVGYAELIADEAPSDDPISGYATEILAAGRSVRATVERFHTLHRMARADVGSFDVRHSLEQACNTIIARSDGAITVSLNVPPTSLIIGGHSQEIFPVLRELADVAAIVIGGSGAIAMTVSAVETPASQQLSHGTLPQGEYARITLLATATGSNAPEGSEVGNVAEQIPTGSINEELAIARSAIYLLGGALHIQGLQNTHSRVEVYLPLLPPSLSNQERASSS